MDKSVFIVGGDDLIERMFRNRGYHISHHAKDASILCFTGGHDVTPAYYNDRAHPTTRNSDQRDAAEARVFHEYPEKLKVGICRGSQFLNVMSGGKLWQDVNNHAIGRTHLLTYLTDSHYIYPEYNEEEEYYEAGNQGKAEPYAVTSTHHQMMKPDKETSELWGYTINSTYRDTGRDRRRDTDYDYSPDVEIVFYEHTKSMCFQPHPEYGVQSCEDLFFTCLDRAAART